MDINGLNPLDIAVVVIVVLSALLAFARGFVREVLSIGAWVGAALVTLYAFPLVKPFVRAHIERQMIADGVAIITLFVAALLVLQMICHTLAGRVSDSALSAIDRSLGFGFGVLRGAVLVSLGYMLMGYIWPDNKPDWLRDARTRPALEAGADMLRTLAPSDLRHEGEGRIDAARMEAERALAAKQDLERLQTPAITPAVNAGAKPGEQGYNDRERTGLDQLIENSVDKKKPE
ncbi:CvpA family protein [Nitrospirillum sp. BR 11828]|uniref:CvpA family protein n=1 Tax=Nitrospirillum sp. BR 11828 TaxID=3104325 RepID=UPI002ACA5C34|nr:CvpA family protein [Nitrospirillum sp. BR 11828]MDZ5649712.1 CvpA family protein [Nitrospirillum sp. BR 11828]